MLFLFIELVTELFESTNSNTTSLLGGSGIYYPGDKNLDESNIKERHKESDNVFILYKFRIMILIIEMY